MSEQEQAAVLIGIYTDLQRIEKAPDREVRNARYLAKLDRAFAQLDAGNGQEHELIEDE